MESLEEAIKKNTIPEHVAIIMDGNGRWAKKQGLDRIFGHRYAIASVRECTEAAAEIGVKFLTLYTFSTENWNRSKTEVDALMTLLVDTIEKETDVLHKNNVKLLVIGDMERLPGKAKNKLNGCIAKTAQNTGLSLILALSYSSRWEILNAVKNISSDIKGGKIKQEEVTEDLFSNYLTTKNIPDPDLLIRTSGELRISNFLLWQIAYSEFYFTKVLWPEFRKNDFYEAIADFQKRERRFGK